MITRKLVFEVTVNNELVWNDGNGQSMYVLPQDAINSAVPLEDLLTEQVEDEFCQNLDKVLHQTPYLNNLKEHIAQEECGQEPEDETIYRTRNPDRRAENRLIRVVEAINILQEENLI